MRSWRAQLVVDVCSAAEFEAVHIWGSHHVPLPTLAEHTTELARHLDAPDHPVVLVCQSGARAEQARQHLPAVTLDHAHVLHGGSPAYAAAVGNVVRESRAWALERQVRLGAGSVVLAGLTAGRQLSPQARLLATGTGAGLTVAALSGTCTMGSALARLPFNRATTDPAHAHTRNPLRRHPRKQ